MPLYIAQSGDLVRCYRCLTDRQTLKDRATQLLIKYKSGALVTQCLEHLDLLETFFLLFDMGLFEMSGPEERRD